MSSSSSSKMIVVKSSDRKTFEVEEAVAMESQTIKHMIEDNCADTIIEYCKKHVEAKDKDAEDLKSFDAEFVKVDNASHFDLILAANYPDIKGLLDLTCQTVKDRIKDMTVEQMREMFNIKHDFTPEEEAEIRTENAWAFE